MKTMKHLLLTIATAMAVSSCVSMNTLDVDRKIVMSCDHRIIEYYCAGDSLRVGKMKNTDDWHCAVGDTLELK